MSKSIEFDIKVSVVEGSCPTILMVTSKAMNYEGYSRVSLLNDHLKGIIDEWADMIYISADHITLETP